MKPIQEAAIVNNNLPRVVVIGAGFAGINLIKILDGKPVQVILIDQHNYHQFQPLLYQVAISGLEPDSVVTPVRKLFKSCSNLIFRMAKVESIDPENNRVITDIGFIRYDYLVIATGSSTNYYGAKDIEKNSIGLKNINDAINIRSWMIQSLEKAIDGSTEKEKEILTKFVVVGGGPAGVEMAGSLAEFKKFLLKNDYPEVNGDLMQIFLIQSGNRVLPTMSVRASEHALKGLKDLGVDVILDSQVIGYDGENIKMKRGAIEEILKAGVVIWTAGVKGNIISGIGNEVLAAGNRTKVNTFNQVEGFENIFAIGDIAAMDSREYPKGHPMVAQVAIQQGNTLGKNILSLIQKNKFNAPFSYEDKGSMATIGKKNAVADLKLMFMNGKIGWLIWSFIHLISITRFRNKIAIAINWIFKYITYDNANQLIIRKFNPGKTEIEDNI
ncbi:MAG: NAD(P)/FAD-dependent oxidoreductase [Saprospiraceae bacterium]